MKNKRRFVGLSDEVKDAIMALEKGGLIELLRDYKSVRERYIALITMLPEMENWHMMSIRHLVLCLQRDYRLDFKVCPHYQIEGKKQYCTKDGEKFECTCIIPHTNCGFRDIEKFELIPLYNIGVAA